MGEWTSERDAAATPEAPELQRLRDAADQIVREHAEAQAQIVRERDAALARVASLDADLRLAAGELRVPMTEPGTDMARLLAANVMMRRERDEARDEVQGLTQLVCDWQAASGLERGGDPSTITPADCERNVQALMAEVERLRAHIAAQTWDADCDRLPGLEAQVERLTGLVTTATVEAARAQKERDEARAALAEPTDEEADRLVVLAFDASVAAMGDRTRHPNEPSRAAMRAILADLRQRAGVTS